MEFRKLTTFFLISLLLISSIGVSSVVATPSDSTTTSVESYTRYNVLHNTTTDTTTVEIAVRVTEPKKYSHWTLTWTVPKNATIENVSSRHSTTVSVERDGTQVRLVEKDGDARHSETFYLKYTTTDQLTQTKKFAITQYGVSLSALSNASSYASITITGKEIANAVRYTNHTLAVSNHTVIANGTGPINLRINQKTQTYSTQTDDYVVYNRKLSKQTLNNSYAISTMGTGTIPNYKQVPVIVLSKETYQNSIGSGSAGQYSSGIIYLNNESLTSTERILPLLTHEYTHAITQRVQPTSVPRWFTEGASQYTESIALTKLNREQNTINTEQFWDYHSKNKAWVVTDWGSPSGELNYFAYAYSELLFKYKMMNTNATAIHTLYEKMSVNEIVVTSNSTPSVLYDDWNGKICDRQTKQQTIKCAENTMEYTPKLQKPDTFTVIFAEDITEKNISVSQIQNTDEPETESETDSQTQPPSDNSDAASEDDATGLTLQELLAQIIKLIQELIEFLLNSFATVYL